MTMVSSEEYKAAMQPFGAAVTVITTRLGETLHGMTATAVCSLSADPPSLLVCINRSASIHDQLLASRSFCVNLLGDHQIELANRFSNADEAMRPRRFEGLAIESLATGAPVLPDAVAAYDCRVVTTMDGSSHTVFIGLITGLRTRPERAPLMYQARQYRRLSPIAGRVSA